MSMKKGLLLAAVVAIFAVAYYFFELTPKVSEDETAPLAQLPAPAQPPTQALTPAEPVERYPLVGVTAAPEKTPLPELDESDAAFGAALSKLFGQKTLVAYFYNDRMIRRFVATIDNLPRHEAPARMMPIKPVGGAFLVQRSDTGIVIDPANERRYLRYLDVMASVDVRHLVDLYIGLYPVFQQAYRELGFPEGYFNDRLVTTLDDLLSTPDRPSPLALQQPKVLYEFADPALEARSAGQRIMLRMGAENRARAKTVLGAIRHELLSRSPAK